MSISGDTAAIGVINGLVATATGSIRAGQAYVVSLPATAVPEPFPLSLLLAGLLGVAGTLRLRRSSGNGNARSAVA